MFFIADTSGLFLSSNICPIIQLVQGEQPRKITSFGETLSLQPTHGSLGVWWGVASYHYSISIQYVNRLQLTTCSHWSLMSMFKRPQRRITSSGGGGVLVWGIVGIVRGGEHEVLYRRAHRREAGSKRGRRHSSMSSLQVRIVQKSSIFFSRECWLKSY